ncbi:MAG: shikimate dehydrogenase, partial [Leptospira sp.]|nr:shikimate dehydrogenase [Leptospira sp.]
GIHAFNTDGYGAVKSIEESGIGFFEKKKGDVLILGSGGSARGISYALLKKNLGEKNIIISSRNSATGQSLANDLNSIESAKTQFIPLTEIEKEKNRFSLVINTTPVGMKGNLSGSLLPENFFSKKTTLFDIVYNPFATDLVKSAKKAGSVIIPGYEMLIHQAMKQFFLFTGIKVNRKYIVRVRKKILKALK